MTYYVKQGGPIAANTYLLFNEMNGLVVIDPTDAAYIRSMIEWKKCNLLAVLLTHGHFDHISGLAELLEQYPVPVYVHEEDKEMLSDPVKNGLHIFYPNAPYRQIQGNIISLHGDEDIRLEGFANPLRILHTPGHTKGSVCYRFNEPNHAPTLFTGDTLFAGSIGRTDLYGGSASEMRESMHRLSSLPSEVVICPGHGPSSDAQSEKLCNPYFR